MRKQKKMVVWPTYIDASRTRREGRKVPRSAAISTPSLHELQEASAHLGLKPEVEPGRAHPSTPWRKVGRMWVNRRGAKIETLIKISSEVASIRKRTAD